MFKKKFLSYPFDAQQHMGMSSYEKFLYPDEIPMHAREENRNFAELVIIDEAERLKPQAFELIREIYDAGGTTFIFIGMPGIDKVIERYPQLYSRVGFVGLGHRFASV